MTPEERFEAIERNLDILTKIHLDSDREYREWHEGMREWREGMREWYDRMRELTERNSRDIEALKVRSAQDGEHILALARIAEAHQQRLDDLEEK
jgi:hypothetical protein